LLILLLFLLILRIFLLILLFLPPASCHPRRRVCEEEQEGAVVECQRRLREEEAGGWQATRGRSGVVRGWRRRVVGRGGRRGVVGRGDKAPAAKKKKKKAMEDGAAYWAEGLDDEAWDEGTGAALPKAGKARQKASSAKEATEFEGDGLDDAVVFPEDWDEDEPR
ncbi:unnamed protein product, partial [Prorocentrum cordatum]